MLAVLEKRGGVNIGMSDAYVNVIGGLQLDEPSADLALVLAAASSFRDKPIDPSTAAIGEVGLTGEIRAVTGLQQRLTEAARTISYWRPYISPSGSRTSCATATRRRAGARASPSTAGASR